MTRLLMTSIGTLLALLAGALPGLQAQRAPSISFELSPGHSAPWDTPLTATITLEYLDFASYSSVVFHADITGHEDKTRECFGQDTERDMTIEVDESEEVFTVRLFTPCNHPPGVGGSYYYTLDLSVLQIVRGPPEQRLELATARTAFLTTEYLTPGEAVAPRRPVRCSGWTRSPEPSTSTFMGGTNSAFAATSRPMTPTTWACTSAPMTTVSCWASAAARFLRNGRLRNPVASKRTSCRRGAARSISHSG